jgi:hypothetical protein
MLLAIATALLLLARNAAADAVLTVDASSRPAADGTALHLVVRNTGDTPAHDVRPTVHHQGVTREAATHPELAAGASHEWTLTLAPPAEPGAVPAIIDVHYADATGTARTIPHVVAVETPGLPPADVTLDIESTPIARYGRATLTLENRGPVPIHGRVVVALPSDLITEPVSQAADVAPGERVVLPIVLQRQGAVRTGVVPLFAFFDYGLEGRRHVVVRAATLDVTAPRGVVSPLIVGGTALALAFAALAIAWRIAARRRAAAPA